MKIRFLKEILKEFPNYKPFWKMSKHGMESSNFGSINLVVICKDDGRPIWDQPQILEHPGVVIIPYYKSGTIHYLGIIKRVREIIIDPETNEQGSTVSREFPRGFANVNESLKDGAKRELKEETGEIIERIYSLGSINPLTSYHANQKTNEVFAALVNPRYKESRNKRLDKEITKERILGIDYFSLKEINSLIKENKIFCGLTLAALSKFKAIFGDI